MPGGKAGTGEPGEGRVADAVGGNGAGEELVAAGEDVVMLAAAAGAVVFWAGARRLASRRKSSGKPERASRGIFMGVGRDFGIWQRIFEDKCALGGGAGKDRPRAISGPRREAKVVT